MADNPFQSYGFNEAKSSPKREYFSGANVKLYFGDVWVDQLSSISYAIQEQVTPIYGFRSYTYDRISRGTRYVSGEFTLNFTENGYLQTILDRIALDMADVEEDVMLNKPSTYATEISAIHNIEDLLKAGNKNVYEEKIEALQKSFWGEQSIHVPSHDRKEQDVFYYGEREGNYNPLKEHGFNILIDYSPDANRRDFYECLNGIKTSRSFYDTFRTIVGVQIVGEAQSIVNNGQIIQQTFQFIARDLDGDITVPSLVNNFRFKQRAAVITTNPAFNSGATGWTPGENTPDGTPRANRTPGGQNPIWAR